jgi:NADPH-dependent ferric siderophore reductase
MTAVAPFRPFLVEASFVRRLSPAFQRITFSGVDLDLFADNGYDQRIKLIVPLPGVGIPHLDTGPDWYAAWRALPDEKRNPMRTYTVRAVRPERREVDVDFVLHGDTGPASGWATRAVPGDAAILVGPNAAYDGAHGGVEFRPTNAPTPAAFTAWLAGEAGVMRTLRRTLLDDLGLDRGAVSCMGYWRAGRSEN